MIKLTNRILMASIASSILIFTGCSHSNKTVEVSQDNAMVQAENSNDVTEILVALNQPEGVPTSMPVVIQGKKVVTSVRFVRDEEADGVQYAFAENCNDLEDQDDAAECATYHAEIVFDDTAIVPIEYDETIAVSITNVGDLDDDGNDELLVAATSQRPPAVHGWFYFDVFTYQDRAWNTLTPPLLCDRTMMMSEPYDVIAKSDKPGHLTIKYLWSRDPVIDRENYVIYTEDVSLDDLKHHQWFPTEPGMAFGKARN